MNKIECDVSELIGRTLVKVEACGHESVEFIADDGTQWIMFHEQDCCEQVELDDIVGDLSDLVGAPIIMAEVASNRDGLKDDDPYDTCTWTFFKFATINGYVTLRWYGQSNGYYSEAVDFFRLEKVD